MAENILPLSMKAVVDNIVFSKTQQVAYYRVTDTAYDYLSQDSQYNKILEVNNTFSSLMSDKAKPVDVMVLITYSPFDVNSWARQAQRAHQIQNPSQGYDKYVNEAYNEIALEGFAHKETYLAVTLGDRGDFSLDKDSLLELTRAGFKGAVGMASHAISSFLKTSDIVSSKEEKIAREREKEYYTIIKNSSFNGERCSSEEILLLLKKTFHPAMISPQINVDVDNRVGAGDIVFETAGVVEEKMKYIKITQIDEYSGKDNVGYMATLSFSKLPDVVMPPWERPFFTYLTNYTMYSRFTLIPAREMKSRIEKKKADRRDEVDNYLKGDTSITGEAPADLQESLAIINEASNLVSMSRDPWVEGVFRIVVEAPTLEALEEDCARLKKEYLDRGFPISWSQGDQLHLFLESMPGDHIRSKGGRHILSLPYLGATGFNFGSDLGDKIQTFKNSN